MLEFSFLGFVCLKARPAFASSVAFRQSSSFIYPSSFILLSTVIILFSIFSVLSFSPKGLKAFGAILIPAMYAHSARLKSLTVLLK